MEGERENKRKGLFGKEKNRFFVRFWGCGRL